MEHENVRSPFCLRLTASERLRLEQDAGSMPLGAYVRSRLFPPEEIQHRRQHRAGRHPVKDRQALGQLLAALGQSHIANNLNQLARAANSGSLLVFQETEQQIREAYEHVVWMRQTLIQALASKPEGNL